QVLKNSRSELIDQLANFDIVATKSPVTKQGVVIEKGNVIKTPILGMGHATVQDESSMLVSEVLNAKPNVTVLDSCSAPGGKATNIAEMMPDKGRLVAYDLHKNKIKSRQTDAKRVNLSIIEASPLDARNLTNKYDNEPFDRVLIDAPCSGLSVISNKPDIKYN